MDLIQMQLDAVLASREFARSESLRRFLRHAVDLTIKGEADRLKESLLGVELFGRGEAFDPRIDPIVRVQAGKLRSHLDQYYANEGREAPVLIQFPKGTYIPVFRGRKPLQEVDNERRYSSSRASVWRVAGLIVALLAAGTALWWKTRPPAGLPEPVFTQVAFAAGSTSAFPTISRQGNLVAYASDRGQQGNLAIFVQALGVDQPIRLTSDSADDRQLDCSPDGTRIVFRSDRDGGGIYITSLLSKLTRKIADGGYQPRFSPDGAHVAYQGDGKLYTVPSSGGEPREVKSGLRQASLPMWTPDGRRLLVLAGSNETGFDWRIVPLEGGEAQSTGAEEVFRRYGLGTDAYPPVAGDWIGDHVVFSAGEGEGANLWQIPMSLKNWRVAGAPVRLTSGPGVRTNPRAGVELDGRTRIVFTSENLTTHIYSLPIDDDLPAQNPVLERLTRENFLSPSSSGRYPQVSVDGLELVFCSSRSGNADVWIRDLRTGRETAVAANPWPEEEPVISRDGSKVAYISLESHKRILHVWNAAGGSSLRVCDDCGTPIDWTNDGRLLVASGGDRSRLRVVDVKAGAQQDLLRGLKYSLGEAKLSPDGRWIAVRTEAVEPGCPSVFLARFSPDEPARCKDFVGLDDLGPSGLQWSADRSQIYFFSRRDGFRCIWRQPLQPDTNLPLGNPIAVRHFHRYQQRPSSVSGISVAAGRLSIWLTESSSSIWLAEFEAAAHRHTFR